MPLWLLVSASSRRHAQCASADCICAFRMGDEWGLGASLSPSHFNIFMLGPVALQSAGNESLSVTVLMFVRAFFREDRPLIGDAHLRSVCMYLRIRNSSAQFKASCGEVAVLEMVIFSLVASLSPWAGIDAHAWSMRHVGSQTLASASCLLRKDSFGPASLRNFYAVLSGNGADTSVRLVCHLTAAALIVRGARGTCMPAAMLMHTLDVLCLP